MILSGFLESDTQRQRRVQPEKTTSPSAFIGVHLRFHMLGALGVLCGRPSFFCALRVFFGGAVVVRESWPVVFTGFPAARE